MTIALSAVIKPSRLLLILVAVECTLIGVVGGLIAFGNVGNLLLPQRASLATLCILAAAYGLFCYYRGRRTIQIDISGAGDIKVAEIASIATTNISQISTPMLMPAQLLQGTTIWSHLLLLRLRLASGSVRTIAILPDCVSKDTFRVLSVASRWIAAHAGRSDSRNDSTNKTGAAGLANE
jgi:toxin CptA